MKRSTRHLLFGIFPLLVLALVGLGCDPLSQFIIREESDWQWGIVAADQASRSAVIVSGQPGMESVFKWQWNPATDPNVRAEDVSAFQNISECKFRDDVATLLVCASGGGVAGNDISTRRAEWYAKASRGVAGPHSLDLLPDGRVAVANSTGCDALEIIDFASAPLDPSKQRRVRAVEIPGAHGVEWDFVRHSLFVLGYTNLYEFAYAPETMSVRELRRWNYVAACGDEFGHDLVPDGRGGYYMTNQSGVWRFDPGAGTFASVRARRNVKSFSRDATKGDLLQVPTKKWWSDRLIVIDPDGNERTIGPFPGARFYKARWERTEDR